VNRTIVRRVLYPGFRSLRRDRVLSILAEMREVDKMNPDQVRDLQWKKLKRVLEHASLHVPYYRRVFKEIGASHEDIREPKDLLSIPLLRKQDIRENLKDLIAETAHAKALYPEETGGSTGQNLFFYFDRQAFQARKAAVIRMNEWLDVRVGDRKASLWGLRFRESKREKISRAIKCWFDNTLYISAYRMDPETVARAARRLNRFKPDMLVAYPSSLYHFARLAGSTPAGMTPPKVIIASGETLYDWQRVSIEAALDSPVYNHYGCCEFSAVARECRRREGLHVAADRVYVEAVPMIGQAPGTEMTELVITGLDNYGMPFIRYAIEDLGSITWEPCTCGLGLPRLRDVQGRVYDVIRAPNGNFLGGTFWGHILKEGVEKFQVTQNKLDEVVITIVPTDRFGDGTKRYVLDKVREACGNEMKVIFDLKKDIDLTRSGKHRYIISNVVRPGGAMPPSRR
jgi:phenylacetate-CoA ligase